MNKKIAVAGTGYVGLSLAVLLAQHNQVTAVDIVPELSLIHIQMCIRDSSISVEDPDPVMAKTIVDEIANASSEYIGDIMEMVPPKMIEDGEVPQKKSSPSNGRNAVLGALIAVMLVCGSIVLQVLLNDTVQTEEDVAKYLELTVLASVPERVGEVAELSLIHI